MTKEDIQKCIDDIKEIRESFEEKTAMLDKALQLIDLMSLCIGELETALRKVDPATASTIDLKFQVPQEKFQ